MYRTYAAARSVAGGSVETGVPLLESTEARQTSASYTKQFPLYVGRRQMSDTLTMNPSKSDVQALERSVLTCEIRYITFIDKEAVHTWLVNYEGSDCYFNDFLTKSNTAIRDFIIKSNHTIKVEPSPRFCLELEAADMNEERDNQVFLEEHQFTKVDYWIRQILRDVGSTGEDLFVQIIRDCRSRPTTLPCRVSGASDSKTHLNEAQSRPGKRLRSEQGLDTSLFWKEVGDTQQPDQSNQTTGQVPWTTLYKPRETPLITGGNDLEHLRHYLNWLEAVGYIKRTTKEVAQKGLDELGFGFELLRHVRQEEWEQMGVPRGAAMQILSKDKAWVERNKKAPSN